MKYLLGFFLAATLSAPAWAANPAQPGTINYVEGKAFIGSRTIGPKSVGSAEVQVGETLSTHNGRVEVLLTPGVFLRLDHNSSATMVSPGLTNTDVRLNKGSATVEVDEIHKENHIRIEDANATTTLKKTGFYAFNADHETARVLKGEAMVREGDRNVKLNGDHVLALNNLNSRPRKMDKKLYAENNFYQWSSLRSKYLAEANANEAQTYASGYWPGTGWYWDPWFDAYTFIPGSGVLYSPFGWGYYSPLLYYNSPFYGYGPGFGFGYGYYGHRDWDHHELAGGIDHDRAPLIRSHSGALIHNGFADRGTRTTVFRGNPGFKGGEMRGGGFRGGTAFHADSAFHGGGGFHGGDEFHGGGGFHGGGFHGDADHGR